MIFRILCGIIIVLGFSYGGFLYAERLKKRLRHLELFCDGLSTIEFNIRYLNSPLAEAFYNAGKNCSGAVSCVFDRCAKLLAGDVGNSPEEAFCRAIDENVGNLTISNDEIDILKSFSRTLGDGDKEAEISNIKTAKIRLLSAKNDASEEIMKRVKMSRSMGVLLGLFIVIVLI